MTMIFAQADLALAAHAPGTLASLRVFTVGEILRLLRIGVGSGRRETE
jgi:hypothetical protein